MNLVRKSKIVAWASEAIADDYDEMASASMDLANLAAALGHTRQAAPAESAAPVPEPVALPVSSGAKTAPA